MDEASTDKAIEFYSQFVQGTLHRTNCKTAEMCKLTENSSRDVQIAFANELSLICDKAGINVWELISLANKHHGYHDRLNCGQKELYAVKTYVVIGLGRFGTAVAAELCKLVLEKQFPGKGLEYATKIKDATIALYKKCAEYALSKGIIIADTKFEFGLDENGNMVLGDEMLTPDSSRFWPADGYEPGHGQPSFDKQFARDWLKANPDNDWTLPDEIVEKTIDKYLQSYEMLTGEKLA